MMVFGIHPVLEAIRAGRARVVRVADRADRRLRQILEEAQAAGVSVQRESSERLEARVRGQVHQGVVAEVAGATRSTPVDLVARASGVPFVVVLDGIEDPHNVGAIIRTCDAAGSDGIVLQDRRSAARSAVAAKASAGAVAHVPVAEVVNLARALDELKAAGLWTVGLAGEATTPYDQVDLTLPVAVVLGAEGVGLRRLVREKCDFLVSVPMGGHVGSLNVSVAAGVALFEVVRQRRLAPHGLSR
jgi:23S rRNA (guanosine2251-2'-O)-methyltransferase